MDTALLNRISLNPSVGHGKPTIRQSRYLVESILEYLSGGDTVEDLTNAFPDLERADILACIAYATEILKHKDIKVITVQ